MSQLNEVLRQLHGKSTSQLSPQQQTQLSGLLSLGRDEADAGMSDYYLVVPLTRVLELRRLNQGRNNLAEPVSLADGTQVLHISLLTDCDSPTSTFKHLKSFLVSLKVRQVRTDEWPTPRPEP